MPHPGVTCEPSTQFYPHIMVRSYGFVQHCQNLATFYRRSHCLRYSRTVMKPLLTIEPHLDKSPRDIPLHRCAVPLGLWHHQTKPERREGCNTCKREKGATISRILDEHTADGITERRPD